MITNLFIRTHAKKVSVILIRLPHIVICGGVLLPGQRVVSADLCIPSNFTNIKVHLLGSSDLFLILQVDRKTTVIKYVSSFRHKKYRFTVQNLQRY